MAKLSIPVTNNKKKKMKERIKTGITYLLLPSISHLPLFLQRTLACMSVYALVQTLIHMYTFPCEKFFLFLWCSFIFLDTYTPLNTILALVGFYYVLLHVYAYMV